MESTQIPHFSTNDRKMSLPHFNLLLLVNYLFSLTAMTKWEMLNLGQQSSLPQFGFGNAKDIALNY